MASQEGSGAAGRAVSSLTLHSEGAGGVERDPLQGKGRQQDNQVRGPPQTSLQAGMGSGACPVSLSSSGVPEAQSTASAEAVPELGGCWGCARAGWVLSLPHGLTWHGEGRCPPGHPRRGRQPAHERRPSPAFPGQGSLAVTVKARLIPVIFS